VLGFRVLYCFSLGVVLLRERCSKGWGAHVRREGKTGLWWWPDLRGEKGERAAPLVSAAVTQGELRREWGAECRPHVLWKSGR